MRRPPLPSPQSAVFAVFFGNAEFSAGIPRKSYFCTNLPLGPGSRDIPDSPTPPLELDMADCNCTAVDVELLGIGASVSLKALRWAHPTGALAVETITASH
jgi:hypothetical protein